MQVFWGWPGYSIQTRDPTDCLVNGMMELLDAYQRLEIALKLQKRGRANPSGAASPAGAGHSVNARAERPPGALCSTRPS